MIPEAERDPSLRDENKKSARPPDSGARRVMQRTAERNQRENEATKKYRKTYKQAVAFCCQLLRAPSLSSSRNVSTVRNVCSVFHVVVIPCSSFLPLCLCFCLCLSLAFLRPHRSSFVSSLFTVLCSSSTAGVFFLSILWWVSAQVAIIHEYI